MYHETSAGQPPGHRITSRITTAGPVKGPPRTCLPAWSRRTGSDAWRFPEGDEAAIVRGED